MYLHIVLLDIAVRCAYIAMTGLISSNYHTLLVSKVTNTAVFQRVELVFIAPS